MKLHKKGKGQGGKPGKEELEEKGDRERDPAQPSTDPYLLLQTKRLLC